MDNELKRCVIYYSLNVVFIIGILLYIGELLIDYNDSSNDKRTKAENVWIVGYFVMLICGFISSLFC